MSDEYVEMKLFITLINEGKDSFLLPTLDSGTRAAP